MEITQFNYSKILSEFWAGVARDRTWTRCGFSSFSGNVQDLGIDLGERTTRRFPTDPVPVLPCLRVADPAILPTAYPVVSSHMTRLATGHSTEVYKI